eukprot:755982-Rhodomonas_salina.4
MLRVVLRHCMQHAQERYWDSACSMIRVVLRHGMQYAPCSTGIAYAYAQSGKRGSLRGSEQARARQSQPSNPGQNQVKGQTPTIASWSSQRPDIKREKPQVSTKHMVSCLAVRKEDTSAPHIAERAAEATSRGNPSSSGRTTKSGRSHLGPQEPRLVRDIAQHRQQDGGKQELCSHLFRSFGVSNRRGSSSRISAV